MTSENNLSQNISYCANYEIIEGNIKNKEIEIHDPQSPISLLISGWVDSPLEYEENDEEKFLRELEEQEQEDWERSQEEWEQERQQEEWEEERGEEWELDREEMDCITVEERHFQWCLEILQFDHVE